MDEKSLHILWEGSLLTDHSFSMVNRSHCANLMDWDVAELSLIPHEPDQFQPEEGSRFARLMALDIRKKGLDLRGLFQRRHIWIRHTWPPKSEPPGKQRWVAMLPWEYSLLPVKHVETLEGADEIWTPSEFSANALRNSGMSAPVHVIPNGVDLDVFTLEGSRHPLIEKGRFTFLYVGGTIYRKGVDLLLEAYAQTFSDTDNVRLVIKDLGTKQRYHGQTAGSMVREYQSRNDVPEIIYIEDDLSPDSLSSLYRSSDVLVAPYRGEGFSLPTLEAMACGTPAIVTKGGATDDFVDQQTGWRIPSRRISVGTTVYGDDLSGEGFLLEPDKAELGRILRHAYESERELADKGLKAARSAADWSWQSATLQLLRRIDALCDTDTATKAEQQMDQERASL